MEVDWDLEDNVQQVRDSVHHLLKGYSIAARRVARTKRCSCVKSENHYGRNVHALIGKTPRVHSTCEIEEVEEEEVQEDSVAREEYRALVTVREERRKMVMKRRKMGMKTRN